MKLKRKIMGIKIDRATSRMESYLKTFEICPLMSSKDRDRIIKTIRRLHILLDGYCKGEYDVDEFRVMDMQFAHCYGMELLLKTEREYFESMYTIT